MLSKANVAVCSDIRTKHSTQSEHHVEFLNIKPWWYVKKPLDFKRLIGPEEGSVRIEYTGVWSANYDFSGHIRSYVFTWKMSIEIL